MMIRDIYMMMVSAAMLIVIIDHLLQYEGNTVKYNSVSSDETELYFTAQYANESHGMRLISRPMWKVLH